MRKNQDASRILLVDDSPAGLATLEALLMPEGYECRSVVDGRQALEEVPTFAPDVILLDVMMPGIDGFEVSSLLKSSTLHQHIPIILITALDSQDALEKGLRCGADEFLRKPVSGKELRARVRSMLRIKKQYDQLKQTITLREDMTNMLVHDIRNPLTVIMSYCQVGISEDGIDREMLEEIEYQARRVNGYLNDMLILAKMEQGQLAINPSTISPLEFVSETIRNHELTAGSKNIEIALDCDDPKVTTTLDVDLWARVMDNLISNAVKYSPSKTKVEVSIRVVQADPVPELHFIVADEGHGIPLAHRERIFERFEVVKLKRKGPTQVGLGLAFCKQVVESHQGAIWVKENHPQGSIFTASLPLGNPLSH